MALPDARAEVEKKKMTLVDGMLKQELENMMVLQK